MAQENLKRSTSNTSADNSHIEHSNDESTVNRKKVSLHDNHPMIVNSKKYVEPPDGGWGWVIVVAVWLDNVLVIGMLKSFGVLFPAFRSYFNENAAAISWINSISLSMRATAAPLSAALSNKFGEQRVVACGGILVVIGLILSMFATSPYFLYGSLGCITGMGFALASLPALTMIGRYFKKRRSLANGLSRCGGGATFFLAPVLQLLVDSYGWQGCLLIIAGLELHLIACAMLFRPLRLKEELEFNSNKTLELHQQSVKPAIDQANKVGTPNTPKNIKPGIVARRAISEKKRIKDLQKEIEERVQEYGVTESLIVEHFPRIEPVYQPKKKRTLDFSLLKNPVWCVITTNLVLTQFGYSLTLVHTVARAKLMGLGEYEAAILLSVIGFSEVAAQLSSGAFADKAYLRRIHLHKIYITVMAIATACSLLANSFATMVIYCIVFGCGSGSWQGNILPVTVDTLGIQKLRSAYGFCLFFSGVCGQLIGPPVAGALYDSTQSYSSSFIMAAICFAVASLVLWLEIPAAAFMKQKEEKEGAKNIPETNGTDRAILLQEMNKTV